MFTHVRNWPAAKKIAASFATVIFVGSVLLTLPISQLATSEATYFDNLFTSVSMVCVTGLFIKSVADSYTVFGQIVCMFLMQTGGLGLMTLIASIVSTLGRKMNLRDRLAVQEGINQGDAHGLRTYLRDIIKYTAVIEAIAFALLSFRFVPLFGWGRGLFTSLFLTISGFNNAGFDNLGNVSLIEYVDDPLVNLVIAALIILGGIGFSVWFDVTRKTRDFVKKDGQKALPSFFRSLSLHTRLAILVTLIVIAVGTVFFLSVEYTNPQTIGNLSFGEKLLASFFQTVTMRTAGFATIDYTKAYDFSLFWFVVTMFIGGSPGGTAGGLKTTTFAMVVLLVYNEIKGQKKVNFLRHTIPVEVIRNAFVVFTMFLTTFIVGSSILSLLNPEVDFIYILFETISALATVGVSANLTPTLEWPSHVVLMLLMFAGRIGPITLVDSMIRQNKKVKDITYSRGNILIG